MRTTTTVFSKISTTLSPAPTISTAAIIQRSPWHSPVPYLFGGLAAMLGLIAFALLILACSYWRLTGREERRRREDLESGHNNKDDSTDSAEKSPRVFEEKILVIMAGDQNPTFLATPVVVCAKFVSTFGDGKCVGEDCGESQSNVMTDEKAEKEVSNDDYHDHVVPDDDVAVHQQRISQ